MTHTAKIDVLILSFTMSLGFLAAVSAVVGVGPFAILSRESEGRGEKRKAKRARRKKPAALVARAGRKNAAEGL